MSRFLSSVAIAALMMVSACDFTPSTDSKVQDQQEKMISEAQAQVGLPAIVNFQEKRMAKSIYELRDSAISTHAYIVNAMAGCLVYLGQAVGYGLPYATQYSNPQKLDWGGGSQGWRSMPQAEPNGLFMPSDAHGTWVLLKDPESNAVKPVYIEPDVLISPFRLHERECK